MSATGSAVLYLSIIVAGCLPLCFAGARRHAAILNLAWALIALAGGLIYLLGQSPSQSQAREVLVALAVRIPILGLVYRSVPIEAAVLLGLNALVWHVIVLARKTTQSLPVLVSLATVTCSALVLPSAQLVSITLNFKQSLQNARVYARQHPDDAAAQLEYAQWLSAAGELDEAIEVAECAGALDNNRHWDYPYTLGRLLLERGDAARALKSLALAYNMQRQEKPPMSLAAILEARGLAPEEVAQVTTDGEAWHRYAKRNTRQVAFAYLAALILNERWQEAEAVAGSLSPAFPEDVLPRRLHLLLLWARGRHQEAAQELPSLTATTGRPRGEVARWAERHREPRRAMNALRQWALAYRAY